MHSGKTLHGDIHHGHCSPIIHTSFHPWRLVCGPHLSFSLIDSTYLPPGIFFFAPELPRFSVCARSTAHHCLPLPGLQCLLVPLGQRCTLLFSDRFFSCSCIVEKPIFRPPSLLHLQFLDYRSRPETAFGFHSQGRRLARKSSSSFNGVSAIFRKAVTGAVLSRYGIKRRTPAIKLNM